MDVLAVSSTVTMTYEGGISLMVINPMKPSGALEGLYFTYTGTYATITDNSGFAGTHPGETGFLLTTDGVTCLVLCVVFLGVLLFGKVYEATTLLVVGGRGRELTSHLHGVLVKF